jgi:uncharacterized protein with FMN-binding domain
LRRSPIVVIATLAGVAGVLSYPTHKPHTTVTSPAASGPTTTTTPAGTGSATGTSSTTTAPAGGTRSATGKAVQFGYGQLAVKVTVSGNRITDVGVASFSTIDSYSQQIGQQVLPTLRHEVLSAQSSRIQLISGASYTSEAYAQSLQAALASLHA